MTKLRKGYAQGRWIPADVNVVGDGCVFCGTVEGLDPAGPRVCRAVKCRACGAVQCASHGIRNGGRCGLCGVGILAGLLTKELRCERRDCGRRAAARVDGRLLCYRHLPAKVDLEPAEEWVWASRRSV